jgi:hypothetical protein
METIKNVLFIIILGSSFLIWIVGLILWIASLVMIAKTTGIIGTLFFGLLSTVVSFSVISFLYTEYTEFIDEHITPFLQK